MFLHKWSGWPGAICLKCGCEDPLEAAIADGSYDPVSGIWTSQKAEEQAKIKMKCPIPDSE